MNGTNQNVMAKKKTQGNEKQRLFDISSLIIIATLAFSCIFYLWKIIFSSNMLPGHSSDLIEFPVFSQIESVLVYHQLPLWDNLWIGGFPEYASPISALYDPLVTVPYFIFGLITGAKVIVVMHVFLAGLCFWLFSTTITNKRSLQLYGSLLFMLSGSLVGRIDAGHTELLVTQMFIPLSMFFVIRSVESKNIVYVIFSSISISMFIFGGAIYYFVFFIMMFGIYSFIACFDQIQGRTKKMNVSNVKILSLIFIFTLMFCSIKLLPALLLGDNIVRIDPIEPFKGSGLFKDMLTSFVTGSALSGYGTYESYSYLGFLPFTFAILSVFNRSEKKFFLYPSFIVFLLWAGGSNNVFGIFRYFPLFDNLRVPGRSLLFASFIIISLSIYGFEWFLGMVEKNKKETHLVFYFVGLILFFEIQEILVNSLKVSFSNLGFGFFGLLAILIFSLHLLLKHSDSSNVEKKTLFALIFCSIY